MKQTAVEWLMQQLKNIDITHKEVFEQAKAMEREQIIDDFNEVLLKDVDIQLDLNKHFGKMRMITTIKHINNNESNT